MIAFPDLLVRPAIDAGIKTPNDIDGDWSKDDYPHWHVFTSWQLGRAMPSPSSHWENAKTIAAIPEDRIRHVTFGDLQQLCV